MRYHVEANMKVQNLKDIKPLILPVIKLKLIKIQKRYLQFIVLFQRFQEIIKQE